MIASRSAVHDGLLLRDEIRHHAADAADLLAGLDGLRGFHGHEIHDQQDRHDEGKLDCRDAAAIGAKPDRSRPQR